MTDFGVFIFPTDYSIQPVELAKEAEGHGFESIFFPEHTHIPTARTSPYPGGGDLPTEYWHSHDPLVALAAVAGATETIRLGTGITLITEHDPLLMAKQVASLDVISNGRVILGIGAGWNKEEMGHHGVAFKDRWKVTRERILGDAGDLDGGRGGVPRGVRRFRSGVGVPEAGAKGRAADSDGGAVQVGVRSDGGVLRRLDADCDAGGCGAAVGGVAGGGGSGGAVDGYDSACRRLVWVRMRRR